MTPDEAAERLAARALEAHGMRCEAMTDDILLERIRKLSEAVKEEGWAGRVIAAASNEYYLCLAGIDRAQSNQDQAMFDKWCDAMHRVVLNIARNPPKRYVDLLMKVVVE